MDGITNNLAQPYFEEYLNETFMDGGPSCDDVPVRL